MSVHPCISCSQEMRSKHMGLSVTAEEACSTVLANRKKVLVVFISTCVVSIIVTIINVIQTDHQWQIKRHQERIQLQAGVDPVMLKESNTIKNTNTNSPKDSVKLNVSEQVNRYFKMKPERVNAHNYSIIVTSKDRCKDKPFLILLCPSKYSDIRTRRVIRNTWASVVRTGKWPLLNEPIESVTMVFFLGLPDTAGVSIQEEISIFKDIVVMDFIDSYYNLTTKVLMGLKWITSFCSSVRYVLKVDQDSFVHIPNLITYLKSLTLPEKGLVAGRVHYKSAVCRKGRWGLMLDEYPFVHFPPYVGGGTYVISGNALQRMIHVAEHLPYLKIEDVFYTGIVRRIIGAKIHNRPGFLIRGETKPRVCDFHNKVRISATNTDDDHKVKLWKALHKANCSVF